MAMNEEASKYVSLLKKHWPDTSQEMRHMARESFIEGWIQCELELKRINGELKTNG